MARDITAEQIATISNTDPQKLLNQRLWLAARDDDIEGVKEALAEGANLTATAQTWLPSDNEGHEGRQHQTALEVAASRGHSEIVELLAEKLVQGGYTLDKTGQEQLNRALIAAIEGGYNPTSQTVDILLAAGANPNAKDEHGNTALMIAIRRGLIHGLPLSASEAGEMIVTDSPLAKKLIKAGADINAQNSEGQTALMIAAMHRDGPAVNFLLEHGADHRIKDGKKKTALEYAKNPPEPYTFDKYDNGYTATQLLEMAARRPKLTPRANTSPSAAPR